MNLLRRQELKVTDSFATFCKPDLTRNLLFGTDFMNCYRYYTWCNITLIAHSPEPPVELLNLAPRVINTVLAPACICQPTFSEASVVNTSIIKSRNQI